MQRGKLSLTVCFFLPADVKLQSFHWQLEKYDSTSLQVLKMFLYLNSSCWLYFNLSCKYSCLSDKVGNAGWSFALCLVWTHREAEPRRPLGKTNFGRLYLRPYSFSHHPDLLTLGCGGDVDQVADWQFHLLVELSLHLSSLVHCLHHCWCHTSPQKTSPFHHLWIKVHFYNKSQLTTVIIKHYLFCLTKW